MTCTTAHQLIQEALDLPGLPQPALEAHLETCASCRSYADGMQRLARELGDAAHESAPVALMERLGLNAARRQSGRRWLPLGIVAAGMLVVMGLGPRLAPMSPGPEASPAVVAEAPEDSLLGYFDPAEAPEQEAVPF